MINVQIYCRQTESADATERDEPMLIDGRGYSAFKMQVVPRGQSDYPAEIVALVEANSGAENAIRIILEDNDSNIEAGIAPESDIVLNGFMFTLMLTS